MFPSGAGAVSAMPESSVIAVLQWLLFAFFLIPTVEVLLMILGAAWARWLYLRAPGKFTHLIIQITSVGREPELVQRTVNELRGYGLPMSYEVWVVIEPGHFIDYENADRVVVVPRDFECQPIDKARALEYTRRLRADLGLNRPDVKILLVDDDTLPSKTYVRRAFEGDYDVCQGVTVPNRWFAVGGWRHFLLSHLDNIRTRNCLIYCSCTQGVLQRPLFVHGEGLCITGRAEEIVTWDRPIVASDDLVFGTNAAHLGLSWGYFHAAIQLVSPWTFRESLNQRWRWTWGNFDAIADRDIVPFWPAMFKAAKYAIGFASVIASSTGAILLLTGIAKVPPQVHKVFLVSLVLWFVSYGLCGWINAGGAPNRQLHSRSYWWRRIGQCLLATILTPVTALAPVLIIGASVLRGRPRKFVMITKANDAMKLVPS